MKTIRLAASAALLAVTLHAPQASAFCGFYVAKADTKLFNKASQVVMVRHDDKTVMTMANDFKGDPKEFAIVVPVPTFLEKDQIHVADKALIDHLDAYSSPRLVEYFDPDPCAPVYAYDDRMPSAPSAAGARTERESKQRAKSLGVTIEAEYTVGEYDILILSAKESSGLETWLREENYKIPDGASDVLGSYIKQKMRFFVAKVNLEEQSKLGFSFLRPIQVAYESPKFMLPIRLGTVNADGPQELFVYALTRRGRVETTNYRTVKLPSGMDIPVFVKEEFGDFYKAMFDEQVEKEDMRAVFQEYAWNMNWCDPCAADPLSAEQLRELGVFWLGGPDPRRGGIRRPGFPSVKGGAQEVFITRLHVRYDARHFPEDLVFQETADTANFQARFVLRHPFTGSLECPAGEQYKIQLRVRQEQEAKTLANLTGWRLSEIRPKMDLKGSPNGTDDDDGGKKWYQKLWK